MPEDRALTPKEQKAIAEFERVRPGAGAIAENNIHSSSTGWAEIIADTPESDLVARKGSSTNTFMYRRIGG